jgi:ABC-type dipeptide/oligopeptide/nickel transport system permease component
MLVYIIRRFLALVPVLVAVSFLVFIIFYLTPGDPVRAILGQEARGVSEAELDRIREQFGLNRPWYQQYADFVYGALQGDLGTSFQSGRPVFPEISARFPLTLQLTFLSLALAAVLGVGAGVATALRPRSILDAAVTIVVLLGVSMPVFWLGILLMHAFALNLGWLPPSGVGTWRHMVLPALTVAFPSIAFIARMARSSLIDELGEDYVRTARAKGLGRIAVLFKHSLKGALIPVVTTLGLQFGHLLGGAVVVETIFSLPGLGRLTVDAIQARDLPMIQGAILWIAVVFNLVNLLVDVLYLALDPRIRYT